MALIKIGKNGEPLPKGSRAKAVAWLDKKADLMWDAVDASPEVLSHSDAMAAASAVKTLKLKGWRGPTIDELETLRDRSRYNPAADPALGLLSSWYWSSSPDASDPDCAWIVLFSYGGSFYYHRDGEARVRAVRSVSPASASQ